MKTYLCQFTESNKYFLTTTDCKLYDSYMKRANKVGSTAGLKKEQFKVLQEI